MTGPGAFRVETTGSSDSGPCDCCGNMSRSVCGLVYRDDSAFAAYFVRWTLGRPDHGAGFDIVFGKWGDQATAADRQVVSLDYRLVETGPAFMVTNAQERERDFRDLAHRALRREEVIGTPLADDAYAVADAVLAQDSRIEEILGS